MKQTFENWLETYWLDNKSEGQTKDQIEDAFENWLEQLDVAEVIELAEKWGETLQENKIKINTEPSDMDDNSDKVVEEMRDLEAKDLDRQAEDFGRGGLY